MLSFVLGTAGTGKTSRLIEKIACSAREGKQVYLIVPEQFSFQGEEMLLSAIGPRASLGVQVVSFTRLCNSIFRGLGGLAGTYITPAAKYLMLSVAVSELRDTLQVYRKSCSNTAFLDTLLGAVSEFKTAGITPERLEAFAAACPSGSLADKSAELSAIYSAYQALLDKGYLDSDDDLLRACALLEEEAFFQNAHVYVDGFMTFMSGEMELLRHILAQAQEVCFAFTADGIADQTRGTGAFAPVKATIRRLIQMAQTAGAKIAAPEILALSHRFKGEELRYLAENFHFPAPAPFYDQCPAVTLISAADPYEEMERVACSIRRLAEEGFRYRDIAVVARKLEDYTGVIQRVFSKYDIPCFLDTREDIESSPLISGLLLAMEAVRSNFESTAMVALAKSPLMGLDRELVWELENYCYSWGVGGALWQSEFVNNPRGLAEEQTEQDAALLGKLNELRSQFVQPFLALRESFRDCDGEKFARGLFDFLTAVEAPDNLTAFAQSLPQEEQPLFLEECRRLWDSLVDILDIFGTVLGGIRQPIRRMTELFRLAVGTADIGSIPQTLDQVIAGGADRIRPGEVKAVFVVGAGEGIFPAQVGEGGLFTDGERRAMIESGLGISQPALEKAVMEKYFAYFALTLASHKLEVSYSRAGLGGGAIQPSSIVGQLLELFPGLALSRPFEKPSDRLYGRGAALELLAQNWRQDTPLTAALAESLSAKGNGELLAAFGAMEIKTPHTIEDKGLARQLFGKSMRLSPSRIESYYRCPFAYFAGEGLRLRPRRRVEYSPLESGSVIHQVLQVMLKKHSASALCQLSDAALKEEISQIIQGYLEQRIQDVEALPARFKYLFTRLVGVLLRLLRHMGQELSQSQFEPVEFELEIPTPGKAEALSLVTPDGISVTVEGIVDRVDVMESGGRRYIRVVDYKSGRKRFDLTDLLYGLNMQMLIYLFTLEQKGKGGLADAAPAGVLYMPVWENYISAQRETGQEELEKTRQKNLQMNGLLLEDRESLSGMEAELAGIYIPVKMKKDGSVDSSSLASYEQMGRLAVKVQEMVGGMAQALVGGKIDSCPVRSPEYQPCAYCPYWAMCGFEEGDPVQTVAKVDKERFFQMLKEDENG
ncbi:PD-(D/E)XK nuclease family protein [Oscillospiraceae bacterium MB08-C2-2]|nr:PD-(D/E)XK nuclease family protein [Oscillospiraceae bacterium MB08-C2-2]